jgi:hypothetical protein
MLERKRWPMMLAGLAMLTMVAAACGGGDTGGDELTGSLNISGSSTVEPISSLVAEKFQTDNPGVEIAVDGPGTSDGLELFCNGETDISDASRAIDEEEIAACEANGISPVEIEVGLDALTVIGNPANPIECLTFGDLYALFGPESAGFDTWADANDLAPRSAGTAASPTKPSRSWPQAPSRVRSGPSSRSLSATSSRTASRKKPSGPTTSRLLMTTSSSTTRLATLPASGSWASPTRRPPGIP